MDELDALCLRVLGRAPERVETFTTGPSSERRGTRRLQVAGRTVHATRRLTPTVAEKEARVLRALDARGAPVPRFLAFEDGWLLQESAGDVRLSETLNAVEPGEAGGLLREAVESLAFIQAAGREAGLAEVVPAFATGEDTARKLLENLHAIGTLRRIPLPTFDEERVAEHLGAPGPDFIKWDARPANAAVGRDGVVRWFDWQHANRRHASDDLVWLLLDETVPEKVAAADLLVELAPDWKATPDRVCAVGVAHVGMRLQGILKDESRMALAWADCLANDWLGSRESARRLCRRGADLSRHSIATAPLAAWFTRLASAD
ncbi:MAG: RIO1 family regulatory kinase/ATPase domain-containing protein [Planctomycetota bacterium]|jgi:hypothetical protein